MNIRRDTVILQIVGDLYSHVRIAIPPKKNLIFLCGSTDERDSRKRLKKYFDKHYQNRFDFIFAEDLNLINPTDDKDDDLLTQENYLANYSDCIMIVLESPSSFVELGAFVNYEKNVLATKLLIVNNLSFANSRSFVNLGPIKRIQKISKFKKIHFYKDPSTVLEIADQIIDELSINLPKNKKIKNLESLASLPSDKDFEKREQLIFCQDLISLLSPITEKEFINIFQYFTSIQNKEIIEIIGVLRVLKYIEIVGDKKYLVISSAQPYQFLLQSYSKARARILKRYMKYDSDRMRCYYEYCAK